MARRKVGFLHPGSKESFKKAYSTFVRRLLDIRGEDRDVRIIDRWAADDTSKNLQEHAEALVAVANIEVIVAAGGPSAALRLKDATSTVPVVFTSVADPVGYGLVTDLDAPGGNITGIAGFTTELDVTRLELLRELLPKPAALNVGILNNSARENLAAQYQKLADAAATMNIAPVRQDKADLAGIKAAFAAFRAANVNAVLVTADSLFNDLRADVVAEAGAIPTIYQWREFAEAGGLMSYGPNILEAYEMAAEYVGDILDGMAPADLPVSIPNDFELVINLRTVMKNNIKVPASLLKNAELVRRRRRSRQAMLLDAEADEQAD
ncbi:MAG: ABC transporter substrate-binding protein [Xanthobacteraceae bacterium]